jgi:predicted dehydrogenase
MIRSNDAQLSFLIAGLGSVGKRHLRNLLKLGYSDIRLLHHQKSAVPDPELAPFPAYYDVTSAVADRPTAVIVANATFAHMDVALKAAKAGCHLFLEKPISHSCVGLAELLLRQDKQHLIIATGFQFRFHPALREIKRWLDNLCIGPLVSVQAHWGEYLPGWHPWEDYRVSYAGRRDLGGGVVLTLCHPFDYLRWLVGEVRTVYARTARRSGLEINTEDTAAIILEFSDGTLGTVYLDYVQREPDHRLTFIGQNGCIRWNSNSGIASMSLGEPFDWQEFKPHVEFERNIMFVDELADFIDAVRNQREPVCTLRDGISALNIALSALIAAEDKKEIYVTPV